MDDLFQHQSDMSSIAGRSFAALPQLCQLMLSGVMLMPAGTPMKPINSVICASLPIALYGRASLYSLIQPFIVRRASSRLRHETLRRLMA